MKHKNVFLKGMATLSLFFITGNVYAEGSGSGSHGGTGSICAGKVELAEFKEVRVRPGLAAKVKIAYSEDISVDEQIAAALGRLKAVNLEVGNKVETYLKDIRAGALPITSYDWGFSNDVNFYPTELGCELKTIVFYLADDMVEYRLDLYSQMSKTDQAGLWVHEAIYKLNRELHGSNGTLMTRRIVSALFDPNMDIRTLSGLIHKHLMFGENEILVEVSAKQYQKGIKFKANIWAAYGDVYWFDIYLNGKSMRTWTNRKHPNPDYLEFQSIPEKPITVELKMGCSGDCGASYLISAISMDEDLLENQRTVARLRKDLKIHSGITQILRSSFLFLSPSVRLFELGK